MILKGGICLKVIRKYTNTMVTTKKIIVLGAGGFIGSHLVKRLKGEGFWVKGVDLKYPEFEKTAADEFIIGDLCNPKFCEEQLNFSYDEVYQTAADMGGAEYVFTGNHDADVMRNSSLINLQVVEYCRLAGVKKVFFPSSACVYPEYNQMDPKNPKCSEDSVYPADPDSDYGWEKIFAERLYLSYMRNYGLDVRIARFHNVFGPYGTWKGGREKAPAAICRKVAQAKEGGYIEIIGDGEQTRSFLYIEDCLEGVRRLMEAKNFHGPVNIGSEEMVSIKQLARMVIDISGKKLRIKHIKGPQGVRGRNSDNRLIRKKLGWEPKMKLMDGLKETYKWIKQQVNKEN